MRKNGSIQAYLIHLIAHDERLFKMGRRAAIKVFSMRRYLRPEETKLYDRLASHSLLKPRYRYYYTSFSTTGYANIHSMRVAQYVVDEQMCQCRHYVGSNWPKHSIGLDSSAKADVHCVYKCLIGLLVCGDTRPRLLIFWGLLSGFSMLVYLVSESRSRILDIEMFSGQEKGRPVQHASCCTSAR